MEDSTTRDRGVAARLLNMRRGELPLALLSAAFFFFVLCGYFFLRPVREAMGVARGMDELRGLFVVTSLISLLAVLAFGGVVARMNRRRFIPAAFLFVIACLLIFSGLIVQDARAGGGLIGTGAETALARGVGYTFYVWLTVVNLFTSSLFWAFMVDIFDVDQGKRMFAFVGIGGTLGALAGAEATSAVSATTESPYLPAGLMLLACVCYCVAITTMLWLDRMAVRSRASRLEALPRGRGEDARSDGSARIGGNFWEGAKAVAASPYLLGVGLWVVFMAISNTMIYFTQANVIQQATDTFSQRVESFADFDFLAQFATLLTQIFVTTRIVRKLGVGWTLAILPLVTVAGFAVLAAWPLYGAILIFQAVHRATRYAISRPARETLFSVVTPAEKYKAKPAVDVFLYRAGDAAGAGIDASFAALGMTLALVAASTVPLAGVWIALSIWLGRAQAARVETRRRT